MNEIKKRKRICFVNSYLNGRETDCDQGLYPRHHLWGADSLEAHGYDVKIVPSGSAEPIYRFAREIGRLTRFRFGNPEQELRILGLLRGADAIYVVTSTDIFWLAGLRALKLITAKLVVWRYTPVMQTSKWKPLGITRGAAFLTGFDGIMCLTDKTALSYRPIAPRALVKRIDWGADLKMFSLPPRSDQGEYFLCCGRTGRDFETLIKAAREINFPVRMIIANESLSSLNIPANVTIVGGPKTCLDDRGISYAQLKEQYANARAVLIPRLPDENETSGYTNLLEALAVGKPVIMTRTGCLDFEVEEKGVGLSVEPYDVAGWVKAMNLMSSGEVDCLAMGERSRKLAESYYNTTRFGNDVCAFFDTLLV